MFVDKVSVIVRAGDGGDGHMSFRREKFIDHGGPDGGDGGDGGDVVVLASRNQNTLATYRYQKLLNAESGKAGSKQRMHGKSGDDLVLKVPVGTVIMNEKDEVIADLHQDGERAIIAKGGKGGFGNAHFVSSVRQAPRIAEKGEKGESMDSVFELKMIADVGIVGLPNAGKSTLLSKISNARPEIADYPFTTLRPNLGMVDLGEDESLLFADIPGLIEGASEGKGLGDEFLRHIERTRVLIHMIDIYDEDVAKSYQTVQNELRQYKVDLTARPQIVALNKIDGVDAKTLIKKQTALQKVIPAESPIMTLSAASGVGLDELLYEAKTIAQAQVAAEAEAKQNEVPVIRMPESADTWEVEKVENHFVVRGKKIERFAARTDFSSSAGTQRLRDIMKKMGILHELRRKGAEAGQKIHIGNHGTVEF